MKKFLVPTLGLAIALMPGLGIAAEPEVVKVTKAGDCEATVGQEVQFVFRYDGFAGQVISGLEVAIDGKAVPKPEVVSRPDPKQVEVGVVTFVFRPDKPGTYRVSVTPTVGDVKGKPRQHVLKVVAGE
ncbi:MAG TPA: hypothetical protein VKA46_06125 [Gemmataceae bacterium]|nr:hypothetical protein [Gemmataceae bacterium]